MKKSIDNDNLDKYDFIDDHFAEPPKGVFDNIKNIFPIIGCIFNDNDDFSLGTGFFINENGYFITAAHVLKNKELFYKALISDVKYDFEVIYFEYTETSNQSPLICLDFAICKIIDFQLNIAINFYLNSEPLVNQVVKFSGYMRINQPHKVAEIEVFSEKSVYLYKLTSNDMKYDKPYREKTTNGEQLIDNRLICKNTRSFKIKEYHGMSGGPVYTDNCVLGMLISDSYILSEYIVEKLSELKIYFK